MLAAKFRTGATRGASGEAVDNEVQTATAASVKEFQESEISDGCNPGSERIELTGASAPIAKLREREVISREWQAYPHNPRQA